MEKSPPTHSNETPSKPATEGDNDKAENVEADHCQMGDQDCIRQPGIGMDRHGISLIGTLSRNHWKRFFIELRANVVETSHQILMFLRESPEQDETVAARLWSKSDT